RYQIIHKGKVVAFSSIHDHHFLKDHSTAVVVPITYKGKWEDATLKVTYKDLIHDMFPNSVKEEDQIKNLLGRYRAEWGKSATMKEVDEWGHIRPHN
ncbi:MAG: hypothetical protein KJ648_02090, partial [Candidatus Omnitrophica bacterium]|nr:hypothetical protein [Candidatus Omnitrophota bacterium]